MAMDLIAFSSGIFFLFLVTFSDGGFIGVNYGRVADNLPSATRTVQLLHSQGIDRVKVFDTDPAVLRALPGTRIKVTVSLPNQLLRSAARSSSFADSWVRRNIAAYYPSTQIEFIAVGNEVFADPSNTTAFLIPAINNIYTALRKLNLQNSINISSPIALSALQNSYPPSAGSFRSDLIQSVIQPMLEFLRRTGSPLMVNAYPFFAYVSNADSISLDYALFRDNPGLVDPRTEHRYFSLFDAQIDAVFAALSALKYDDINVVVTETGWPSKGDANEIGATIENAKAYNSNLIRRVLLRSGTPLRPQAQLTVFLFALYNENQKNGPTSERNYGLFYPTEEKVYDIPLTLDALKRYKDTGAPSSVKPGSSTPAKGASGDFCVAGNNVGKDDLQKALDYACGEGSVNCREIQPGGACFLPDSLEAHASYAFNEYYQKHGRQWWNCDFNGAGSIVNKHPWSGTCSNPNGD